MRSKTPRKTHTLEYLAKTFDVRRLKLLRLEKSVLSAVGQFSSRLKTEMFLSISVVVVILLLLDCMTPVIELQKNKCGALCTHYPSLLQQHGPYGVVKVS